MAEDNLIGEPLFIKNAGLILCWPFMAQCFKMVGLSDLQRPEQANRAVQLLQYLVNGKTDTPEFELPLNKLLCGVELNTIINKIELTETEIEICGQMLQAVIQNWPTVQHTSVSGFQESFLQREGKLSESENYWSLQVEKKAFDVLLQQLPWRLSPVYFSWMDKKIEVEWP